MSYLEQSRPNVETEADFQNSASWSQTVLAGRLASAVTNGIIEVYQLQRRLLYFHFGLKIRQEAAIALTLLAECGLEVLYQSLVFPGGIHCHFREVSIAASPR